MDINYIWEKYYPHIIALLASLGLKKIAFNPLESSGIYNMIDGIVTLDSIIIGFIGAIIPVILSMKNESKFVKYIFEKDKEGLFKRYILETIIYGLMDVGISLSVYLVDLIDSKFILDIISFLVCYVFILFVLATYRSMSFMLTVIFSRDDIEDDDIKERLTEKERKELWIKNKKKK